MASKDFVKIPAADFYQLYGDLYFALMDLESPYDLDSAKRQIRHSFKNVQRISNELCRKSTERAKRMYLKTLKK